EGAEGESGRGGSRGRVGAWRESRGVEEGESGSEGESGRGGSRGRVGAWREPMPRESRDVAGAEAESG
ncbi:fibril-forming collagen alpha chain-like, partial [Heterodontus francisci]|uniref:fibril-forming collagen alpha chain-like n=1 Tax=Heterodontus francisci TaxID=7792 RepID=UPI00355AE83B